MVRVCGFYIKGLLESLTSNCIASFIGSMERRGKVGPTGGKGQEPRPGSWILLYRSAQLQPGPQAGWGDIAERGTDRRAGSLDPGDAKPPSPGRERRSPWRAPQPRAHAVAPHRSCSGGNFLSLQLSEASPCPLLVSILSVAHGLGAPVRGPAISHRLASLLP